MAIRAKFKGSAGNFLMGIPARDLDDEEYEALTTDEKALVRASDLYEVRPRTDRSDAPKAGEKGGG